MRDEARFAYRRGSDKGFFARTGRGGRPERTRTKKVAKNDRSNQRQPQPAAAPHESHFIDVSFFKWPTRPLADPPPLCTLHWVPLSTHPTNHPPIHVCMYNMCVCVSTFVPEVPSDGCSHTGQSATRHRFGSQKPTTIPIEQVEVLSKGQKPKISTIDYVSLKLTSLI